MALSEGELLSNRYHIITLIGKGGMADVYKVWDQQRAVHLAIKVLHEDIAMDRVFIRRFQREGQVLERLQHPNIVRFYGLEHEQAKRLVFLLMDLIEGRSLKHEIFDRNGPTPLPRVMELLRPICAALFYAHNQGVVHADIKPGNILINNLGQVFTSDFGIARLSESATVTLVGAGTPPYMAPEQFKGSITPLSDQYSLGIMLFELLTGERPFTGETARTTGSTQEKIFWEHLHAKPPSPRRWNRDISPEIDRIVLRCLEKKPEDRFSSILDLLTQLEAAAAPRLVIPTLPRPLDETVIPKAAKQKPVKPTPQPAAPVVARPEKAIVETALKGPAKGKEIPLPAVQPPPVVSTPREVIEGKVLKETAKEKAIPAPEVQPLPIISKSEEVKKELPTAPPVIPAPTPIPQEVIIEKPEPSQVEPVPKKAVRPKPVRRRAWAFPLIAVLGLAVMIVPLFFSSIIGSRTPNTTLPATSLPETLFIPTMMDTTTPAIVSSITSTSATSLTSIPTRTEPPPTEIPTEAPVEAPDYFTEEFDDSIPDWTYYVKQGDATKLDLHTDNGMLVFNITGEELYAYLMYDPYIYKNVRIDVFADNRGKNTNDVMLVCRYSDEGWYEFNISNGGLWTVYVFDELTGGGYLTLNSGGSTAIRSGRQTNEYTAICNGNTLSLYINGKEITSFTEKKYNLRDGQVGIGVSSYSVLPIIVEFDWVIISEP